MGYICDLGGFIEPSKNLEGKYEPSEKFRGQKQTLFTLKLLDCTYIVIIYIICRLRKKFRLLNLLFL
jgi:hypothetical protein